MDCKTIPSLVSNGIDIVNLAGLWIMLASGLGLAIVVTAINWLWTHCTWSRPKEGDLSAQSMDSNGSRSRSTLSTMGSISKLLSRPRPSPQSFSSNSAAMRNTVHVLGAAGSDEEHLEKLEIMLNEMDKRAERMTTTTEHALMRIAGALPDQEAGAGSQSATFSDHDPYRYPSTSSRTSTRN